MAGDGSRTPQQVLGTLEITVSYLEDAGGVVEVEFGLIKKKWRSLVLLHHPDKGGDAATFREIHTGWETLSAMMATGKVKSFAALLSPRAPKKTKKKAAKKKTGTGSSREEDEGANENTDFDFDMFASMYGKKSENYRQPDFDFFEDAEEQEHPPVQFEIAKTDRAKCKKTKPGAKFEGIHGYHGEGNEMIKMGSVKVLNFNTLNDNYAFPHHLGCWRVPATVWEKFPDPDDESTRIEDIVSAFLSMEGALCTGYMKLTVADQRDVAMHCLDKNNWAQKRKAPAPSTAVARDVDRPLVRVSLPSNPDEGWDGIKVTDKPSHLDKIARGKARRRAGAGGSSSSSSSSGSSSSSSSSMDIVPIDDSTVINKAKQKFVTPIPGRDGPADALAGKTMVMTGIFPEIGGGSGLELGKQKLKSILESFGARVTSSVSGMTDILMVGREPGMSKVGQARSKRTAMWDVVELLKRLKGGQETVNAPDEKPMIINEFSAGFRSGAFSNSLAYRADSEQIAIAMGVKEAPKEPLRIRKTGPGVRKKTGKRKILKEESESESEQEPESEPHYHDASPTGAPGAVWTETITCDTCHADCTESSYAVGDEDLCLACHRTLSPRQKKMAVKQAFGKEVSESSALVVPAAASKTAGRGRAKKTKV